jgi:carboxymethylenebutenolidase
MRLPVLVMEDRMVNAKSRIPDLLRVSVPVFAVAIFALFESSPSFSQTQADNEVANTSSKNISNVEMKKEGKSVTYYDNVSGYLATPQSNISTSDKVLPAVVMIHEWWGLNDNMKEMADQLANEGYVVLAADLFNGTVAALPEEAGELAGKVRDNPSNAIANLQSAVRYLASLENVNSSRIASLGWCFGGGQSLQLALNTEPGFPLAATALYYGNLVTDQEELSKIKWPVLGIFGNQDQSIPVDQVRLFEETLNATSVPNEIYVYDGVGHAFANPSNDNYAPQETSDAWEKTLAFLKKNV